MGPKDCNDAHDDDVGGMRGDDTSGVGDTSGDSTGGVGDVDGAFIGYDDPKGASDDGVVIYCYDPKGASNDGQGVVGEEKPPNCEPYSMMTYVNDLAI